MTKLGINMYFPQLDMKTVPPGQENCTETLVKLNAALAAKPNKCRKYLSDRSEFYVIRLMTSWIPRGSGLK